MDNHQLNSITFALPARNFEISSSVTVNETLPKVNEFVLRLVKVCGGIEGEEIARYFGFSSKEMRTVLNSLKDQSLIQSDGDLLKLTEYAESKFYTDDDIPRFSVVKPRIDNIDFDLLTFNPVSSRVRKKSSAFLVEIPCESERIGSSGRLAEKAYQKNFKKILREKDRTKDVIDIYKISEVKSKRLFQVPLEVRFTLSGRSEIERIIDYDEDATEDFRLAVESAVSDVLKTSEADQSQWLSDFISYFDDAVLRKYLNRQGFDFERYVREVIDGSTTSYTDSRAPILGNLYMPNNQTILLKELSTALSPVAGEVNQKSCVWMAPDYPFWGRSMLLDDFYNKVKELLPQPKKRSQLSAEDFLVLFPSKRETKWILERQLWSNPPKNIHFHSGSVMGGRVEILLSPASFACVLFHYRPPGNSMALVPFGFHTTDQVLIDKAKHLIGQSTGYGDSYIGAANFDRSKSPSKNSFSEIFGFLNYSPIVGNFSNRMFGLSGGSSRSGSGNNSSSFGSRPSNGGNNSVDAFSKTAEKIDKKPGQKPRLGITAEVTEDQVVFRASNQSGQTFRISKNQKWRGLLPLPSVNASAAVELADRIGYDRKKLLGDLEVMKIYVKTLSPADAAVKLSKDLDIPIAEIWRYFIDAMYILDR